MTDEHFERNKNALNNKLLSANAEIQSLRSELAKKEEEIKSKDEIIRKAMHEVSETEQFLRSDNKKLRRSLKDILPIAENHASILRIDEKYSGEDMGWKESQEIIDKAKSLTKP